MSQNPFKDIVIEGLPYEYLKCKNINEMVDWLKSNSLFHHFPNEFLKDLAKLEMEKIVDLKLKHKEIKNLF